MKRSKVKSSRLSWVLNPIMIPKFNDECSHKREDRQRKIEGWVRVEAAIEMVSK